MARMPMRGLVVKNTGTWYTVLSDEGTLETCTVKGNFRIKGIRSTSPVVIGDRVEFADGMISSVDDRRNYIVRKSINLSKQSHILAANLDLCMLIVTVSHPVTTTTFIDRFLANAEAYDIPAVLVFNKVDIYDEADKEMLSALIHLYQTVGYQCLTISAEKNEGIDALRELLYGKITLLSGHSGVGKTTLINRLIPGLTLRTADISEAYDTGKHTTTYSEMYPLPDHPSPLIPHPCHRSRNDSFGLLLHHRHPGNQGIRHLRHGEGRHRRLFQGDIRILQELPFQQLHPYPRTRVCSP